MNVRETVKKRPIFNRFVVQMLIIMFIVEFVKGALLISILPIYMTVVLGASAYIIGWTLAGQYIGDNTLRMPVGWIIDRFGYKLTMVSGVILTFVSILLIALTKDYSWMIVACVILGIGTAPLWPCVITGTTEVAGDDAKGTIMGVVYMAWLSGVGLGPVVINFFVHDTDFSLSLRILLICAAVVVLVALFLPNRTAHQTSHEHSAKAIEKREKNASLSGKERAAAYFNKVRQALSVNPLLFPAMFAQTFALGLLTPILTKYAREILNLSPRQFSFFLIFGGSVTVLALVPVGKLVDRFGTRLFLTIGFALGALGLITFTYVSALTWVLTFVAAIGIGYALIIPAWNALIASLVPKEERGAIWGFFLTIEGLGTIVGPIVSGKLWDLYGPRVPFITSGVVLLSLLFLQLFISLDRKVMIR